MKRRLFLSLAVSALAAGCNNPKGEAGAGNDSPPLPGQKSSAAPAKDGADLTLTGAGATFPYPLYSKWAAEFAKVKAGAKINYQSIGSGGGIRQITERTVDFGASDAPMSDEQIAKAAGVIHIPTCLGAVVLTYNVEGVPTGLKLTPAVVAGMFLGKIKTWNDPAIAKENPDAKLPNKPIGTVHRSDGSGTTKIFVDYLSAVSEEWKKGPGSGTSVNWPGSGLGAKGNEGVSGLVSSTPGSIGYVELGYAVQNKLAYAALQNKAGKFVTPSGDTVTAAAAGSIAKMPADYRTSIVDADGDTAYSISGYTYILLYKDQKDPVKGPLLVEFLKWAVHDGQKFTKDLDYAPLPAELVTKIDATLATVKVAAK